MSARAVVGPSVVSGRAANTPPKSRRARIVQRTLVGVSLAAAVAFLMWASGLPYGARITLAATVMLSLWAIVEADRMGLTASRGATFAAGAASLGCATLALAWLDPVWARPAPFEWTPSQRWWWGLAIVAGSGLLAALAGSLPGFLGGPREHRRRRAWPTPLIVLWLGLPLLTLYPLRIALGVEGLIAFLVLAKVGDIAGYYVGNWIGETHPFPRLSPGKTTAGCVASLAAGIAAGVGLQLGGLLPAGTLGLASGALAGLAVNLAAQAGDLFESAAKRRVGVKDAATTFGPSGGMLDLVDSILLAGPMMIVTWPLLFHWPPLFQWPLLAP